MAIRNSLAVYIDGINRTSSVVMPIKWGDFLDERLDECYLTLKTVKVKNFLPLTPVEIILSNKLYFHQGDVGSETITDEKERTKYYLVANDTATENPIGSGKFDHELYLIEITKYAECVIVDTETITNEIGNNFTKNAKKVEPVESEET